MKPEPDTTPKKPRSNAKLLNLPEAQAAQLRELLFESTSCRDAVEFVQANFGITTGKSAVSDFWRQQCLPLLPQRRHNALQTARLLADYDPKASAPFENAAQTILQERIFNLCPEISMLSAPTVRRRIYRGRSPVPRSRRHPSGKLARGRVNSVGNEIWAATEDASPPKFRPKSHDSAPGPAFQPE